MRIYSKFHDYYDIALTHGIDPNAVYKRNVSEFSCNATEYERMLEVPEIKTAISRMPSRPWNQNGVCIDIGYIIIFCGKLYPCARYTFTPEQGYRKNKFKFCFKEEDVSAFISKYGTKEEKRHYFKAARQAGYYSQCFRRAGIESVKRLYDVPKDRTPAIVDWQCEIGVPISVVSSEREYKLIYNPVLKDLRFYKVLDPYTAFQELSMFISGVMGGSAPPMIQISDEIRLEKHGFDKKTSFRKDPTKRR